MDTQASEGRWGGGRDDPSCLPLSLSLVGNFVAMGRGRRDPELAGFRLLGGGARWVPLEQARAAAAGAQQMLRSPTRQPQPGVGRRKVPAW